MDDRLDGYDSFYFSKSIEERISEFNQKELNSQVFMLFEAGNCIGATVQKDNYVRYYRFHDFYVCLHYHIEEDRVSHCYAFDDYLELIPLRDELNMDAFVWK